ncbi:hypothetical protein PV326_001117, partial [Microctonus aethiopoides]
GKIVCWNFGRSREGDTLVIAVEQDTLVSAVEEKTGLYRSVAYRQLISSILYCGSQESGVRDSSTSPSNGPVEEVRGRRGLRQTSWEAQLLVDHADPTDRTIFVVSLDKIIWWRRSTIQYLSPRVSCSHAHE